MKIKITLCLMALACGSFAQSKRMQDKESWKMLTLREKIGQTMLMLPDRKAELALGGGNLKGFFKKYPVTGFFMGWKLFDNVAEDEKLAHIKRSAREYQEASGIPLIFQQDYENGISLPGMTSLPREMALGAANSKLLAYDLGMSVAREARSVGVSWVLHPVADLSMNPLNPIVNTRGISDDPDKAIRLLSKQISGLQENGVAATIKHFPGDGVDSRDQHLTTTTNSLSMDQWRKYHGKVFQALIDSGVAAIMPGHITLPAYQQEKLNGFFPPATLSRELLTGLLKDEMKFRGVIVSDAMTMGGFRGWYDDQLEGEVQSFLAGVDVLLWPSYAFMDTIEARIKRGQIPMSRLDDAVSRIWAMKKKFGILDKNKPLIRETMPQEKIFAAATARNIAEGAVTLVRDRNSSIPIKPVLHNKILVIAVTTESRKGGDGGLAILKNFADGLRNRGFDIDFQRNLLYETMGWTEDVTSQYDKVIIALVRQTHRPFGPLQLYDDEAQTAWGVNAMPKDKVIVVSFGSPYLLNEYFERVHTCINAYSNGPEIHDAVIKVLTGEIPARGVSPVVLERRNFNLQ